MLPYQWSLFSKTSHALEDGRRLENLSWRLWNRETFCCRKTRETPALLESASEATDDDSMPALSSSIGSVSSDEMGPPGSPPELKCANTCGRRHELHITSCKMQELVQSIEEKKEIFEPLDLPKHIATQSVAMSVPQEFQLRLNSPSVSEPAHDTTPQPQSVSASQATLLESSSSTVYTQDDQRSQSVGSEGSSNTEMSTHSIVRGFNLGGAPSSYRSQTNLAPQPTPILRTSPSYHQSKPKKKGAMFTIGTSSGEDESSFESHMYKSSLSESLKRGSNLSSGSCRKQTSFKDEVSVGRAAEHSPVFEESDDEDDEVSESAIEDDDDDSSDWEDSDEHSGPSSVNENHFFQRVDSRPNLTSRRSLLTTQLHEPDRAKALANAASRSSPAIRRSNRSTPNGPSLATSPEPSAQMHMASLDPTPARPIIMTTSNMHQSALSLSPRTTRRNMLSTELTESLRKNLLWERQHRSTGNLAAMKKRQPPPTSREVMLRQRPDPAPVLSHQENAKKYSNDYFNAGLQEYHAKGW